MFFCLIFILQIERWWNEIHERMEKYFKDHLPFLKDQHYYDPNDEHDRWLLLQYSSLSKINGHRLKPLQKRKHGVT